MATSFKRGKITESKARKIREEFDPEEFKKEEESADAINKKFGLASGKGPKEPEYKVEEEDDDDDLLLQKEEEDDEDKMCEEEVEVPDELKEEEEPDGDEPEDDEDLKEEEGDKEPDGDEVKEGEEEDKEKVAEADTPDEEILKQLEAEDEEDKDTVAEELIRVFEGQNLTKEFRNRVAAIFEATVKAKRRAIKESMKKQALLVIKEERIKNRERMVNTLDRYVNHAARSWFKENRLHVVDGITLELSEGAINVMKGFLSKYNVRVPRSRENLVDKLTVKNKELTEKLDRAIQTNMKLHEAHCSVLKKQYIGSFAEGLSDTEKEKFVRLAEEVSFADSKSYRTKLKSIREGLFSNSTPVSKSAEDFASKMMMTEKKEQKAPDASGDAAVLRYVAIAESGKY